MNDKTKFGLALIVGFLVGNTVTGAIANARINQANELLKARKDKEKFIEMSLTELVNNLTTEFPTKEAQQHLIKFQNDMEFVHEFYG